MRLPTQKFLLLCFLSVGFTFVGLAQNQPISSGIISFSKEKQAMAIVANGNAVPIVIDAGEFPGIVRIAKLFQEDIFQVTSLKPELVIGELPKSESVIIAGTIGKSKLIDQLVASGKINISDLE
ncbi:MAG: hypothetical protein Q8J97_12625, partial [Flavobacteriaceae bacterium]|nr:hypothetical protein [Flavobacteriaceae bacterium]